MSRADDEKMVLGQWAEVYGDDFRELRERHVRELPQPMLESLMVQLDKRLSEGNQPDEMGDCPGCGNSGWDPRGFWPSPCDFCGGLSLQDGGIPVRVGGVRRPSVECVERSSDDER